MIDTRKVAVVGCGFVGSSSAFALMQSGLFSEMVLIDVDRARAEGEALDIGNGSPFAHPIDVYAGDYEDAADAAIIVVTAGAAQTSPPLFSPHSESASQILCNLRRSFALSASPTPPFLYACARAERSSG